VLLTAGGSEEVPGVGVVSTPVVEPQLGEEDINSMSIDELRAFINKGIAPSSLQSQDSDTDLVRF